MGVAGMQDEDGTVFVPIPASRCPSETFDRGESLGRYVILDKIGSGGMGVVYRAYDPKLQREVALKQVRYSSIESGGKSQLVAEAQAMAQLSHPNVIAVYDVEKTQGGVVLAMEYVEGQTIKQWLRERPPWKEVLETFLQAGRGLEAAHAVGLVHRDFKPANVLLGKDGRVRVMDFGLARLRSGRERSTLDSDSGEAVARDLDALRTSQQGQVVGTPMYMSPEQHAGQVASVASDQFSYCLALREGLTFERPYGRDLDAVIQAKNTGPPPWPDGCEVPRRVRDAIDRGLHPDASARFGSMSELLAALRYDPHRARRIWTRVAMGSLVLISGASAAGAWMAHRNELCTGAREHLSGVWDAERARSVRDALAATGASYADAVWVSVSGELDSYASGWVAIHRDACEATNVRGEQSATVLDARMLCLERALVELDARASVLEEIDAGTLDRAMAVVGALPRLDRCSDIEALRAEIAPPEDPEVAAQVDRIRGLLARVRSLREAGRWEDAMRIVQPLQEEVDRLGYAPLRAEVLQIRGDLLDSLARYDEAQAVLREAYEMAVATGHQEYEVLSLVSLTANVGDHLARFEVGEWLGRMAIEHARAREHRGRLLANAHVQLGNVLLAAGRPDEAIEQLEQALEIEQERLGLRDPRLVGPYNNLAVAFHMKQDHEQAASHYRRALAVLEAVYSTHPHRGTLLNNLSLVYLAQGELERARSACEQAYAIKRETLGPRHPSTASSIDNLGKIATQAKQYERALAHHQTALEIKTEALGDEHPSVAFSLVGLGRAEAGLGKWSEARAHLLRAFELWERAGTAQTERAEAAFELAVVSWELPERRGEASGWAGQALELYGANTEAAGSVDRWMTERGLKVDERR